MRKDGSSSWDSPPNEPLPRGVISNGHSAAMSQAKESKIDEGEPGSKSMTAYMGKAARGY